jgi:hypothetical protein
MNKLLKILPNSLWNEYLPNFARSVKSDFEQLKHILHLPQQGIFRNGNMFVVTKDGK